MDVNVETRTDFFPEHHHGDELVPMDEVAWENRDPEDERLGDVIWIRATYKCSKCPERVTIRILHRPPYVPEPT